MLIMHFRLAGKNAMSRAPTRWCTVAIVAFTAAISGCQFLPDYNGESQQGSKSIDHPPVSDVNRGGVEAESDKSAVILDRAGARQLQARLTELGFEPGPIDGIVGPRTIAAVKRFQREHHLAPTGTISPRLLNRLDSAIAANGAGERTAVNLRPADYPTYQPGIYFVFSDGDVDYVSKTDGTTVDWIRNEKTTYTSDRNFLLPWSRWETNEFRGTATVSASADTLWPQRNGAEVVFSANLTVQNRNNPDATERHTEQWRCRNEGRRDITTQAGAFDTIVIACRRTASAAAPEETRTWYYAKSVRHYVRREETSAEGSRISSVDLVAVRPASPTWPPIVRAALARATVHALEAKANDTKVRWASSVVNAQVTIEAKSRFITPDGRPCRHFVQHWSEDDRHWQYPALACKTKDGDWSVPGLGENSASLKLADEHSS